MGEGTYRSRRTQRQLPHQKPVLSFLTQAEDVECSTQFSGSYTISSVSFFRQLSWSDPLIGTFLVVPLTSPSCSKFEGCETRDLVHLDIWGTSWSFWIVYFLSLKNLTFRGSWTFMWFLEKWNSFPPFRTSWILMRVPPKCTVLYWRKLLCRETIPGKQDIYI